MTKRRILVVDDDPSIRRSLNIALTKAGYEVFEAQDGEEATQLWHDNGAELVIADIYIRTKNLNPLSYAKQLGAVRTIAKPFSLDEMLRTVNEELARDTR